MSNIETILLSLLVLDAIALTVLVLIQQGKGADVGAAFGSGSSNTVFGSSGSATFLTKATAWLAIGFFVIAFGLAYTAKQRADASGTLGIPTVQSSDIPTAGEVVESIEERVESSDIPALEIDDVPSLDTGESDIPALDSGESESN